MTPLPPPEVQEWPRAVPICQRAFLRETMMMRSVNWTTCQDNLATRLGPRRRTAETRLGARHGSRTVRLAVIMEQSCGLLRTLSQDSDCRGHHGGAVCGSRLVCSLSVPKSLGVGRPVLVPFIELPTRSSSRRMEFGLVGALHESACGGKYRRPIRQSRCR